MRLCLPLSVAVLAFAAAGAVAETGQFNHLDCRYDEAARSVICPDVVPIVPMGRAAAEPAPEATAGEPARGDADWNARCAAKYTSFDPATGTYRSYSGKTKPCRL